MTKDPEDPYANPSDEVSAQINITSRCVHGNAYLIFLSDFVVLSQ